MWSRDQSCRQGELYQKQQHGGVTARSHVVSSGVILFKVDSVTVGSTAPQRLVCVLLTFPAHPVVLQSQRYSQQPTKSCPLSHQITQASSISFAAHQVPNTTDAPSRALPLFPFSNPGFQGSQGHLSCVADPLRDPSHRVHGGGSQRWAIARAWRSGFSDV